MLGRARKVVATKEITTIVEGKGSESAIQGRIGEIKKELEMSDSDYDKEKLQERLGKLGKGVAVIKVGAATETEMEEKKHRIEDALEATKAAIEEGIVPGGGVAFLRALSAVDEAQVANEDEKAGVNIIRRALEEPLRQLAANAGVDGSVIIQRVKAEKKNMGYDVYDPSEKEIRRMVTELYDYHERITNLQYLPSEKEIRFLVGNMPVQIDGDASEEIEVSNYKDIDRIETNRIRSGPCLVIGECISQKAVKIWPQIKKWGQKFNLDHWSFLQEFVQLQKETKAKEKSATKGIVPIYTYIQDLVAGRPVLTHPLAVGGFRLRYGRCRTSGYSASAIHPATLIILNKFIAIGTQLKVERPGKATAVTICDSIEGPIVKLNDNSIVRIDSEQKAKEIQDSIKEILFLGDILISYGDFFNRAHTLVPAGYCEEWWSLEVEKAMVNLFGSLDYYKLSQLTNINVEYLEKLIKDYLFVKPDAKAAIALSKILEVPIRPYYTYHWKTISNLLQGIRHLNIGKV